jgi:hypothetical protein
VNSRPNHETDCARCGRSVGVRLQTDTRAGNERRWRVSRHAESAARGAPTCAGSGWEIPAETVRSRVSERTQRPVTTRLAT